MFNPIIATQNIKKAYQDYIATTFPIADKTYRELLYRELGKAETVVKGPYLDIGDSYKTGRSLEEMICAGQASELFRTLEECAHDAKKELPLERKLYAHQEKAFLKAIQKKNLIITTGTGSGKTECFLLPMIHALLRESEERTLDPGVRAMIIYPMNALANDQMKRLRLLLKDCGTGSKKITFGVYNSSTKHTQEEALNAYAQLYKNEKGEASKPLSNEILSREIMQREPPNILITNYAMLEYMMLRPKDDAVFSGAKLNFIVLDEAHIYKGATGMETALLMRRLRARINDEKTVRYILTSATLGGKEKDADIVSFATNLCSVHFHVNDIIRSETVRQVPPECTVETPLSVFEKLAAAQNRPSEILKEGNCDYAPDGDDHEKLFELGMRSKQYWAMREVSNRPMLVSEITHAIGQICDVSEQDVIRMISVLAQAEKGKISLFKAGYHSFVRALEGVYITIGMHKQLFLQRTKGIDAQRVFECAICDDCGRLAVCGEIKDGVLVQSSNQWSGTRKYFVIKEKNEIDFMEDDQEQIEDTEKNDWLLCSVCGAITRPGLPTLPCSHTTECYIEIKEAYFTEEAHRPKCPACETGSFRGFYLGAEAATAVLGTVLYEEIPEEYVRVEEAEHTKPLPDAKGIFGNISSHAPKIEKRARQFLCFSDSRSEAAYYACYMEKSYQEFLRRRGIRHIIEKNRTSMQNKPWEIKDFAEELTAYFNENHSFAEAGKPQADLTVPSRRNAWIAILNEMFNARRATSLVSMGLMEFEYKGNTSDVIRATSDFCKIPSEDAKALLDLLVMDIVYYGAIRGDGVSLTDAEREYIFFTPYAKGVCKLKKAGDRKSHLHGWMARARSNGNYYDNTRMRRFADRLGMSKEEANEFLGEYWDKILIGGSYPLTYSGNGDEYYFLTNQFAIKACDTSHDIYRCDKCGRITSVNCLNRCISVKCDGRLSAVPVQDFLQGNHYAQLYASRHMRPLHIKEHTAQLGRAEQLKYQQLFVNKEINALSCSTTFEMGVDVGSLETVYLRNIPPSPANYVQRAGRAGRSTQSAAFCLTYAKLSSHDFTYYEDPVKMIRGEIGVPKFVLENEKVIQRHIFAVALSDFFQQSDVYDGNNANKLLNEDGYDQFKRYLAGKPEHLRMLLKNSIPKHMHAIMGIDHFAWAERLIGEKEGVLEIAIKDYREMIAYYESTCDEYKSKNELARAGHFERELKKFRKGRDDHKGKNDLIEFLVRSNVLPKYGFPVDTVELHQDMNVYANGRLQMARDLQLAISEYAPGSEVIADGKLFTSRYIRKPHTKAANGYWEYSYIAECANEKCKTMNYIREEPSEEGTPCIACGEPIGKKRWRKALEPRKGFVADSNIKEDIPMKRPDKSHSSKDHYIGDKERKQLPEILYQSGDHLIAMQSSTNDSLLVVCTNSFYVCPWCGYGRSANELKSTKDFNFNNISYTEKHKNAYGTDCANKKLSRVELSHTFKTDVVRILFDLPGAQNIETMLSVLFALLESTSRVLDIERTDIKGCLHRVRGKNGMLYSLVLYDAVAGGAGHVRRLTERNGSVLRNVVLLAIKITGECTCSPSCYKCLRNYYNQDIHDSLNRLAAERFLQSFTDPFVSVAENEAEHVSGILEASSFDHVSLNEKTAYPINNTYEIWADCNFLFPDEYKELLREFEAEKVPLADFADAAFEANGKKLLTSAFVWKSAHVLLLYDSESEKEIEGWKSVKFRDVSGKTIKTLLEMRS
ncbi:MAG: DEAD/DEAH box helicase [Clostridiales Family XIII bacterium]|jgi:ATP-dependent helicase YprA (DUF1998 family)|nr:DEAD/DEAH box helicase [Clostridiales Family XIII bacterium]